MTCSGGIYYKHLLPRGPSEVGASHVIITASYQFGVLGGRRCNDHVQLIVDLGRDRRDGNGHDVTVLVPLGDGVVQIVFIVVDFAEVSAIVPEMLKQ